MKDLEKSTEIIHIHKEARIHKASCTCCVSLSKYFQSLEGVDRLGQLLLRLARSRFSNSSRSAGEANKHDFARVTGAASATNSFTFWNMSTGLALTARCFFDNRMLYSLGRRINVNPTSLGEIRK